MGKIIDKIKADPKKFISMGLMGLGAITTAIGGLVDHSRKDDIYRAEVKNSLLNSNIAEEIVMAIRTDKNKKES